MIPEKLTILSQNVRGIHNSVKLKSILQKSKCTLWPDVLMLTETFANDSLANEWKYLWQGPIYSSYGSNHSKGVSIFLSPQFSCKVKINQIDICQEGRYVLLSINWNDCKYLIGAIYGPNRL